MLPDLGDGESRWEPGDGVPRVSPCFVDRQTLASRGAGEEGLGFTGRERQRSAPGPGRILDVSPRGGGSKLGVGCGAPASLQRRWGGRTPGGEPPGSQADLAPQPCVPRTVCPFW